MATKQNPFATRFIRPGAIPFFFPSGESLDSLQRRLAESSYWGQIVGPHGTGKSSLLQSLMERLRESGRTIVLKQLHLGDRRTGFTSADFGMWTSNTQVVVDGYEQVPGWRRWWFQRKCRKTRCGLLVTVHQSVGLPTIWTTQSSPALVHELMNRLLSPEEASKMAIDATEIWTRHGGNLRDVLFDLYDRYETLFG